MKNIINVPMAYRLITRHYNAKLNRKKYLVSKWVNVQNFFNFFKLMQAIKKPQFDYQIFEKPDMNICNRKWKCTRHFQITNALQMRFHKEFDQICASNSMNAGF